MPNDLLITLRVKEDGTAVIANVTGQVKQLAAAADQTGQSLGKAGQAAAQGGKGFDQAGKGAEQAGVNYDRLGQSVAMAQAKLVAMYAAVKGGATLFEKAMDSIDYYEKAIIRMAASATDAFAIVNKEAKQEDLQGYYDSMKAKFGDLVQYTMIASSKYFANAREMLQVMEFAVSRGHEVSKKGVDQIGMMVDKVKQLVPWIRQEGQVLQEVNALWEGHARMTDTWARDLVEKLKISGEMTAKTGKEVQKQFTELLASKKELGWEGFWEWVLSHYKGMQMATKDIQMTWESTKETIGTTVDLLLRVGGKETFYKDTIGYLQEINKYYLEGEEASKRQAELADRVGNAWKSTKAFLADIKPIAAGIWDLLKKMDDGRRELPEGVQEIGVIGFFLVGAKGKAAIMATLALLGSLKDAYNSLKQSVQEGGSAEAWGEKNLPFFDGITKSCERVLNYLDSIKDKFKERIQELNEGMRLKPPPKGLRLMSGGWFEADEYPVFGSPEEWRNEGEDQGWGYWGGLTPAGDYGKGRQVFNPQQGLRDLVREHKHAYDEIEGYRTGLDQRYYRDATEHARTMSQQVGGFYAGMTDAALRYFSESTNMYKQGVKAFSGFTQATEGALMGFFDVIIWRTGKFTDVMTNFFKRLTNALLESLIVQPLVGLISGGLGSLFSGAGSFIFSGAGGFLGNLLGLGGGGQAGIINAAAAGPATGPWVSPGLGGGGGGAGDNAWLGLLGVGGLGLMAAMMSSNEKNAGGAGGSAETMSVQTMTVAQLVVQGMVSGQSGGAAVANPNLSREIAEKQFRAGSYMALFQGTGKTQEITSLMADSLFVDSANIKGLEGFEHILDKAGDLIESKISEAGGILEDASVAFFKNVERSGGDFKAAMEETGRNMRENWKALLPDIIATLGGLKIGGGGGLGGGLGFLGGVLDIFHGGGVIRAHSGMILGQDEVPVIAKREEGILQVPAMRKLGRRNFEALNAGNFEQVDLGGAQAGKPAPLAPEMHVHVHVHALDGNSVTALDWERLVGNHIAPVLKKYYSQWIS